MVRRNTKPCKQVREPVVRWFVVIAGLAFVLRVIYLLQARGNDPLFFAPQMDALYHHRWALAVASGTEFIRDAFFRAPLYPYFLGLLYKLFGADPFPTRLAQAVVGSASAGFVYLLARRLCSWNGRRPGAKRWVPRAAGLVMAAYPVAVYFDGELLIPCLLVFLVLLGFVLLLRSRERGGGWWWPGLAFGLAVIARPNVLVFVAVLPVWFFFEYRRKAWKPLAQLLAAVAVVIAPVAIRNLVVGGEFVPIAWQGGTNFYIGNNAESDGVTAIVPGTRASWWGGYNDVKRLAEQAAGRSLRGTEIDRYWLGKGLEFWRIHPGKALGLMARKAYLLVSGLEISNNRDIYFFKQFSFLNLLMFRTWFLKFPFGLVFPLALLGAYAFRRRWRSLLPVYVFLLAYGLSFVVFFVTARFRMAMVPLFAILAVAGVDALVRLKGRERVVGLTILVFGLAACNLNLAGPFATRHDQNHLLVARALHQVGRHQPALEQVHQALAYDSSVNVLVLEATLLTGMKQYDKAMRAARAAVRIAPDDPEPYGTLGNLFAARGQLDSARVCFVRVVELDPYAVQGWSSLGNIATAHRNLGQARMDYEKALAIDPAFVPAMYHLGLVEYYAGNKQKAHTRWREVLKLEPGHRKARQALEQLR